MFGIDSAHCLMKPSFGLEHINEKELTFFSSSKMIYL